jgi:cytochrome c biogenesis protein CcdA
MVRLLPFGYAFGAGMVTAFSPCSVGMLPAYVSLYFGQETATDGSAWRRSSRAVLYSLLVTAGFVLLAGVAGAAVSAGGRFVTGVVPWLAVVIAMALIGLGAWLLSGRYLAVAVFGTLANRIGRMRQGQALGFLAFGVAYGIAALSCTLPVFLLVVANAFTSHGIVGGVVQFVAFGLGMGLVIILVTAGAVLFKEAMQRWLRRWTPLISRLGGLLLVGSGIYILYYWITLGGLFGGW